MSKSNNKIRAIEILEKQKSKLFKTDTFRDKVWEAQTLEMSKKYFGENSAIYEEAKKINLDINLSARSRPTIESHHETMEDKRFLAERFIDGCIEYIRDHGVYEEKKPNWLYTIKSEYVNLIIVVLAPSIFVFGMWFNSFQSNTTNINALQKRVETLTDSIRSLSNPANSQNTK